MQSRKVLLTGATGYIGSGVAAALVKNGHEVLAVARSADAERRLAMLGYESVRGDAREPQHLADAARRSDAVIHASNTNDSDNPRVDDALRAALRDALRGSGKPFVYTSGVWSLGDTGDRVADEQSSVLHPLPLSAWRIRAEMDVVSWRQDGLHGVLLRPGIAYGRAGGIPSIFVKEAREDGRVRVVGDGANEWPVVHVDDLADLYVRALDAPAGSVLHATREASVPMRDVALAASFAGGAPGALVEWPLAEARQELGGFADALALHQRISSLATRRLTGWTPRAPSLVEDLLVGSYARK